MKYLNLSSSVNAEDAMLRATHEQKGIWLDLICYCHVQMNNGIIKCCHEWTDSMWQRVAGINAVTVKSDSPLWHWSSMVLVIHFYDSRAEAAYKRRQKLGREFAEKRWSASREKKIINLRVKNGSPIESPNRSSNGSPDA